MAERSSILAEIPAFIRFLSFEPALGPGNRISLEGIDWVICGGESGPGYRPMDLAWARSMRRRCDEAGIAFFFKQSAAPRTEMGIKLDGEIVRRWPETWDRADLGTAATRRVLQESPAPQADAPLG